MKTENEIKAEAVKEFVSLMIGAFESGFIDTPKLTLAQLHRVAQNHCKDSYGVDTPTLVAEWGEETAKDCGLGADL